MQYNARSGWLNICFLEMMDQKHEWRQLNRNLNNRQLFNFKRALNIFLVFYTSFRVISLSRDTRKAVLLLYYKIDTI